MAVRGHVAQRSQLWNLGNKLCLMCKFAHDRRGKPPSLDLGTKYLCLVFISMNAVCQGSLVSHPFPLRFPTVDLGKCIFVPAAFAGCAEVTCFTEGEEQKDCAGRGRVGEGRPVLFLWGPSFSHLVSLGREGGDVTWIAEEGVVFCRSQLLSDMRITQNFFRIKNVKRN